MQGGWGERVVDYRAAQRGPEAPKNVAGGSWVRATARRSGECLRSGERDVAWVVWQGERCGAPENERTLPQSGALDAQRERGPGTVRGRRTRSNFSDVTGQRDHRLSGYAAWERKEGGNARHARRRSGREGRRLLT